MKNRAVALLLAALLAPSIAFGQSCPAVLTEAKRLFWSRRKTWMLRLRPCSGSSALRQRRWRALGPAEPALVGRAVWVGLMRFATSRVQENRLKPKATSAPRPVSTQSATVSGLCPHRARVICKWTTTPSVSMIGSRL
jgi:hypothetical protein